MGWFTAKDAPSDEPVRGKTISDKDWAKLAKLEAAPRGGSGRSTVPERVERSERGVANYRNRHRN